MADTSTVGIFSLNDVRVRQNQNAWPNASPVLTVTDTNQTFNFTIDTQGQYKNQFLYYTLTSANSLSVDSFVDNSLSGQLYVDSSGVIKFSKQYIAPQSEQKFTLQLRSGSITGANILNSSNISI